MLKHEDNVVEYLIAPADVCEGAFLKVNGYGAMALHDGKKGEPVYFKTSGVIDAYCENGSFI